MVEVQVRVEHVRDVAQAQPQLSGAGKSPGPITGRKISASGWPRNVWLGSSMRRCIR